MTATYASRPAGDTETAHIAHENRYAYLHDDAHNRTSSPSDAPFAEHTEVKVLDDATTAITHADPPVTGDIVHEVLAMNTLAMQKCHADVFTEAVNILLDVYRSLHTEMVCNALSETVADQLRSTTLNNMGVTECRRGRPQRALSHFEAARQLEEKWGFTSPALALNSCAAYNSLGMYDKSTAAALETIELLRTLELQRRHRCRLQLAALQQSNDGMDGSGPTKSSSPQNNTYHTLLPSPKSWLRTSSMNGTQGSNTYAFTFPIETNPARIAAGSSTMTSAAAAFAQGKELFNGHHSSNNNNSDVPVLHVDNEEEAEMLVAASQLTVADSHNAALWGAAWHNLAVAQINTAQRCRSRVNREAALDDTDTNGAKRNRHVSSPSAGSGGIDTDSHSRACHPSTGTIRCQAGDVSEYCNALVLFRNAMRATRELLGAKHAMYTAVVQTYRAVRATLHAHGAFKQHHTLLTAPIPPPDPREMERVIMANFTATGSSARAARARQQRRWNRQKAHCTQNAAGNDSSSISNAPTSVPPTKEDVVLTFRGEVTGWAKMMECLDAEPYPGATRGMAESHYDYARCCGHPRDHAERQDDDSIHHSNAYREKKSKSHDHRHDNINASLRNDSCGDHNANPYLFGSNTARGRHAASHPPYVRSAGDSVKAPSARVAPPNIATHPHCHRSPVQHNRSAVVHKHKVDKAPGHSHDWVAQPRSTTTCRPALSSRSNDSMTELYHRSQRPNRTGNEFAPPCASAAILATRTTTGQTLPMLNRGNNRERHAGQATRHNGAKNTLNDINTTTNSDGYDYSSTNNHRNNNCDYNRKNNNGDNMSYHNKSESSSYYTNDQNNGSIISSYNKIGDDFHSNNTTSRPENNLRTRATTPATFAPAPVSHNTPLLPQLSASHNKAATLSAQAATLMQTAARMQTQTLLFSQPNWSATSTTTSAQTSVPTQSSDPASYSVSEWHTPEQPTRAMPYTHAAAVESVRPSATMSRRPSSSSESCNCASTVTIHDAAGGKQLRDKEGKGAAATQSETTTKGNRTDSELDDKGYTVAYYQSSKDDDGVTECSAAEATPSASRVTTDDMTSSACNDTRSAQTSQAKADEESKKSGVGSPRMLFDMMWMSADVRDMDLNAKDTLMNKMCIKTSMLVKEDGTLMTNRFIA